MVRDFPSNISCSIFFFPLVYCFYILRPLQIVLVTLSCGAGRREIRRFGGGRVWGISCSRRSLCVKCFPTKRNFKETHNCTAYAKWRVESLKVPSGGILHSSPVLTVGPAKKRYHCAWLVYLLGDILLCSFFQLRCWWDGKLKMKFLFPV